MVFERAYLRHSRNEDVVRGHATTDGFFVNRLPKSVLYSRSIFSLNFRSVGVVIELDTAFSLSQGAKAGPS